MQELVTLPPHLIEKIRAILAADLELPEELRAELQAGLDQSIPGNTASPKIDQVDRERNNEDNASAVTESELDLIRPAEPFKPPTIDIAILERLSRWASSESISEGIKRSNLDPNEYGMIPLLSGTELYIPPSQLPHLPPLTSSINPYLPSYLSPLPPSFGQEYRSLTRQLSTVLNILFSIFGSAFAVYVAATTGGGYSREKGILMGVLAGVVVGVADGVLVWIFGQRVKEGREEGRKLAIKLAKGSGGAGVKVDAEIERDAETEVLAESDVGDDAGDERPMDMPANDAKPVKTEIRLRRRAIGDKVGKTA